MNHPPLNLFSAHPGRQAAFSATLGKLVLLLLLLASSACNLSSPAGGQTVSPGANSGATQTSGPPAALTPTITQPSPANLSDVNAIARQVYDQAQAGQDLAPLLGSLFAGLGIPLLSAATDGSQGLAQIKAGKPVVFDAQLAMLGQGFTNGMALNVDSLMKDLSANGVSATNPAGPLTSAYLKTMMQSLVGKATYTPTETLPALVIALGQERARRLNLAGADPVWADGWLDPLQYLLLIYGISFKNIQSLAGAPPSGASASSGGLIWVENRLGQEACGFFCNAVKDINPFNSSFYLICAAYYFDNTQFILDGSKEVYHKQNDVASPPAYQTTITGTLTLMQLPSPSYRDLLKVTGCDIPANTGPISGKTVAWTLDSTVSQHGSFTKTESTTKANGTVSATYKTIDETVPQAGRIALALQQAQGEVEAQVLNLIDSHPDLEAADRAMSNALGISVTNGMGTFIVDIRYYANLTLDIGGAYQIPGRDVTVTNTLASQTIPLTSQNGTLQGIGAFTIASSAIFNCGSGGSVPAKGIYTGKITVIATPGSGSNNDQLTFNFVPDLSALKPPSANTMCVAGDLNDVAWAGFASILGARFSLNSSTLSYDYTPPSANGKITFSLHAAQP